jgi:hypothetical protein
MLAVADAGSLGTLAEARFPAQSLSPDQQPVERLRARCGRNFFNPGNFGYLADETVRQWPNGGDKTHVCRLS